MDFPHELARLLEKQGIANAPIEIPPQPELGDFAIPCFALAKERKAAPAQIALQIASAIHAPFLERVEAKGPYVNFFIKPQARATAVLSRASKERYGSQPRKNDKVMVEYSQPNTHKAFHVGHLRGTSLGESLARILRFAGWDVVQANYSGDTGMHVAKWLWYYTKREKSSPPADRQELERWIAGIYVKAIQTLEEHPEFQDEVNEILLQVDKREEGPLFDVYKKTREWSIEAFNVIYQELSAHFDAWFFESQVEERGKELSRELVRKGVAKVDKGATIIDLTDRNLGVLVLLRTDGTALYGAKDLALAEKKYEMFKIEKSVHVIGAAQGMYMQQLFVALHSLAFPQEDYHLSFTEVRLPTGKMSSRTGQNLLYSDIKKEVLSYAVEEVSKHHPDWAQERMLGVARDVTIAALKWDMLNIHPNKAIVFDAKEATRFEGETGPYLQYTHARGCSILEKTTNAPGGDGELLTHEKEQAVLRLLEAFPATVDRAAREYAPGIVAHFAMDLAKAFNSFYHDCPVLGAQDEALRADRIALVRAAIGVLGAALGLLAIAAPQEM